MGGIVMERKIGEEFEYNGVRLKVVGGELCGNCYFRDKHENEPCVISEHVSVSGGCSKTRRKDHKSVQFIEIKNEKMKEETKSLPIPEGWEFAGYENGEVKIRRVEQELPTDYEKALGAVRVSEIRSLLVPRGMHGAVSALCKLLIYRNAWWEKLGWWPIWGCMDIKYCIGTTDENDKVQLFTTMKDNRILAFPTAEVRDKFAEAFRDLIEEAKKLL